MDSPSPTVASESSQCALRQTGHCTISAKNRSTVFMPKLTDVHAQGDVNVTVNNNTYVQSAADESENVSPQLTGNLEKCQTDLKSYLETTTKDLFQCTDDEQSTSLNRIYTELYITEGGSGEVNSEHEIIELECHRSRSEENKVQLNDIFKAFPNEKCPQRVLTKGIAGIGKTVAVQKFTYDWAVGEANQDIQFIFPFTFRDLNLEEDKVWSLVDLLRNYFEEVEQLDISGLKNSTVLFIFDGLDESKLHLDFNNIKPCRDIKKAMNLNVLLTNLIGGKLLPKASVWITSRPAAVSRINLKFNRVTEVRGFNDEQKADYFRKKIKDEERASKVLDHLLSRPMRTLYIMCHIPVFCWISATVLETLITKCKNPQLPDTITEMYTHFLIILMKLKQVKHYQEGEPDKMMIMKLGRLAFEQLYKGNIIFYEKDLKSCKIDVEQAAVCSGICTQLLRKESGLHKRKIYSFVHLSTQEFLAALYCLQTWIEKQKILLHRERISKPVFIGSTNMSFFTTAVEQALSSSYGQWDLFLRFMLGLSQSRNQDLLQEELGFTNRLQLSNQEIISYIHYRIKNLIDPNKSVNLFHCLNELDDQSLVEQVQMYLRSGDVRNILPEHWSALAFALLISNENLDVFDLKNFHRSEDVFKRMLPVFKVSKKALLSDCNLTARSCDCISSVLSQKSSTLLELDLSRNELQDNGINDLVRGLQSPNCKLQRLSLCHCGFTEHGGFSLANALEVNPFHLRHLDLSFNNIGNITMFCLYGFLKHPDCRLQGLRILGVDLQMTSAASLATALHSNPSHLLELDLGENWKLGDDGLMGICDLLKNPNCKLEKLGLYRCGFAEVGCKSLADALYLNPSHLKYLDLSFNSFGDEAVVHICRFLTLPDCQLQRLGLEKCWISEKGCSELVSSLRLNPAHLRDLDLSLNDLQDRGVEVLSEFLAYPLCQLNTLRLGCCDITAVGCRSLSSALKGSSSSLRALDLSGNLLTTCEMQLFSDWQRRPECTLKY